jgi:hypothetical protein
MLTDAKLIKEAMGLKQLSGKSELSVDSDIKEKCEAELFIQIDQKLGYF